MEEHGCDVPRAGVVAQDYAESPLASAAAVSVRNHHMVRPRKHLNQHGHHVWIAAGRGRCVYGRRWRGFAGGVQGARPVSAGACVGGMVYVGGPMGGWKGVEYTCVRVCGCMGAVRARACGGTEVSLHIVRFVPRQPSPG